MLLVHLKFDYHDVSYLDICLFLPSFIKTQSPFWWMDRSFGLTCLPGAGHSAHLRCVREVHCANVPWICTRPSGCRARVPNHSAKLTPTLPSRLGPWRRGGQWWTDQFISSPFSSCLGQTWAQPYFCRAREGPGPAPVPTVTSLLWSTPSPCITWVRWLKWGEANLICSCLKSGEGVALFIIISVSWRGRGRSSE